MRVLGTVRRGVEVGHQGVRPAAEVRLVLAGNPQKLGDDVDRDRDADLLDEVGCSRLGDLAETLTNQLPDSRRLSCDGPGRERLVDEAPEFRLAGRIGGEQVLCPRRHVRGNELWVQLVHEMVAQLDGEQVGVRRYVPDIGVRRQRPETAWLIPEDRSLAPQPRQRPVRIADVEVRVHERNGRGEVFGECHGASPLSRM